MQKFRKKPVEVEAVRFDGENGAEICAWAGEDNVEENLSNRLIIRTLEGDMIVKPGWWVIKGVENEFYPCKPEIFEVTYEAVE